MGNNAGQPQGGTLSPNPDYARNPNFNGKICRELKATSLKFVVILGSVREVRVGDRVLKLVLDCARKFEEKGYSFEVVDARALELPVVKMPIHYHKDVCQAPRVLCQLNETIASADGYFMISSEYNKLPCPGLINVLDHLPRESFAYKPSGTIAYSTGIMGGAFAAAGLLPLIVGLNMVPVTNMVFIPEADQTITEDGTTGDQPLCCAINKLIQQVAWWADACKEKRETDGVMVFECDCEKK